MTSYITVGTNNTCQSHHSSLKAALRTGREVLPVWYDRRRTRAPKRGEKVAVFVDVTIPYALAH